MFFRDFFGDFLLSVIFSGIFLHFRGFFRDFRGFCDHNFRRDFCPFSGIFWVISGILGKISGIFGKTAWQL